jgi:hypothetical protein
MRFLPVSIMALIGALSTGFAGQVSTADMVFLTRGGCVNTDQMRSSLDAALKSLKLPTNYSVVDIDKLPASDRRRGYGTPTILYRNRDLFGLAEPPASPDAPS